MVMVLRCHRLYQQIGEKVSDTYWVIWQNSISSSEGEERKFVHGSTTVGKQTVSNIFSIIPSFDVSGLNLVHSTPHNNLIQRAKELVVRILYQMGRSLERIRGPRHG